MCFNMYNWNYVSVYNNAVLITKNTLEKSSSINYSNCCRVLILVHWWIDLIWYSYSDLVSRTLSCLERDTGSLLQWTFGILISHLIFLLLSCCMHFSSPITGLLGYGSCRKTAVGYAGDACFPYLLPRGLFERFLGLDLILWPQPVCFLEQGLQVHQAEEKLAWKSHQNKKKELRKQCPRNQILILSADENLELCRIGIR